MPRPNRSVLAFAALVFISSGCGGKSSKSSNPVDTSGSLAAQQNAEAALGSSNVASANTYYRSALAKNPGNLQAAAGAALTELFLAQDDPAVIDLVQRAGLPVPRSVLTPAQARTARILSRFGVRTSARYELPALSGAAGRLMLRATQDPPLASDVQSVIRSVLLPRLAFAEEKFLAIESHAAFVYKLPPSATGLVDSLEIDRGDVLVVDGLVRQIHAVLEVLVAYDWDARPGAPTDSLFETPGSKWATLGADGASQLAAAKANLLAAASRYGDGITSIWAETDDQSDDVIPQAALGIQSDVDRAHQDLQRFTSALNGPVHVSFTNPAAQPDSERVDLGRFFVPGITDLKTKVPAHTFDPYTHAIVWTQPVTFPDPTFGQLLPDATNARLRFLWGL